MSDRPSYGEYATPEEQRRLAGLPPVDEAPVIQAAPAAPVQAAPSAPAARPWDRIITIALLAYGVVNVFMTAMSYLDLPALMNQSMEILGIDGEFTNFAQGKTWGAVAAVVLFIGWAITAWLSVRRLRRGKLSWWVPLVGAVVTMIITTICITVPMMNDPAFIAYLNGATGQ
ncbi:DUF6264 family protein [Microbacterium sp. A196]|uniref:DUF6264 family protein n=1 Tax=unclassified Microbacterium TaxID=2609290 RepID=UPI003FCEF114